MDFSSPIDLTDAVKHLLAKQVMPTSLDSAGLRGVASGIKRQSMFSAQTTLTDYLETLKDTVRSVLEPQMEPRADRATPDNPQGLTAVGFNPATARERLKLKLQSLAYVPNPDEAGTIKDLSSDARINLIIKTNVETAHSAGRFVQQNADEDIVDLYPALEFLWEQDSSATPRGQRRTKSGLTEDPENGWPARWRAAASESGDVDAARIFQETGRMVALKSSGIWQALGDGAGGYEDTLGNPYPPFAFNSSIETEEMTRDEAEETGLLGKGEQAAPAEFDFASLFKAA